ncbi:5-formyltetrahydrofolate cyclo-ligase [Flavobacteriaceae bacterium]|nr:5-formyltetrahydrofolate cyclo-ligase [Flavobacteriaceae bacterium]MDA9850576.1 5-formyltetrahydrofolate cyclo-ligase [Flavobacteriaceae bacterium]
MNNSKFFFRKSFKKQRSLLDINQVKGLSKRIFENLLELNIWDKSFYHLYLSNQINNEVETDEIVNLLFMKNKRVFVPKIQGKDLLNIEIDNNTKYSLNQLGIREPISSNQKDASLLEVIFVPLLIFDKLGHRVGYGGGYYDKFLGNIKDDVLKIGLSLFEPIDKIQDIERHDIRLDYSITPKRVYDFTLG